MQVRIAVSGHPAMPANAVWAIDLACSLTRVHYIRQDELLKNRCPPKTLDVWRKGVDTNMFHPRHRSAAMRERLSGGSPNSPILVHVGRLGAGVPCC